MDDSGDWMCEAWNEAGQTTQTVRVTIKGKRHIETQKTEIDWMMD